MSFHNKTLLGGGGSAPGTPLTLDEEKETERKLKMLTADPLNSVFEDPEFKAFKTKQYERAFPGKQELDASGRSIEPKPRAVTLEPFKPTVRRDDFKLTAAVGEEEWNRPSDVIKLKKILSNAGIHDLDVTREKSTDAGENLLASLGAGQGLLGTKIDRMVKPGGETLRALEAVSFPPGVTGDKARPVDLTKAAAGASTGSSLLAHAAPPPVPRPHAVQPPAAGATPKDPWPQSPVSTTFREEIHKRESAQKNYQAVNRSDPTKPALGRCQLRPAILQDIGMKDAQGNWTGKYGVTSESDFLKNPLAQEKAFADALNTYLTQLRRLGALGSVGQRVNQPQATISITTDGLVAAAHREGAEKIRQYLEHQRNNGWRSNFSGLPPKQESAFEEIDKRLRGFEKVRRRKTVAAP